MQKVTFENSDSSFFTELKAKVNQYFASNNLKTSGTCQLYVKSIVLFALATTCYLSLLLLSLPAWGSLIICTFLGMLLAAIGFNVMHDGAHGSYSSKKWLNELMSYSLNLMGGNAFIWKNKHNFNHHSYTNIDGMDDDIDIEPWIRTHANQQRHWFHRYQHIYWVVLYGLTYMLWVFVNDFKKYFTRRIANVRIQKISIKEHIIFWVSKLLYISLFFVIPVFKFGVLQTLIGYTVMAFVCGFIISVIFQLAHIVKDTEFPLPNKNSNKINQTWVIHQISTTANFSTKNKVIFWLIGGLNFQVEHHIFPKISHVHYPKINELLKETCSKFNVKYIEYPNLFSALHSHVSYLRHIGVN